MQLYTKILIGMAVGILLGFLFGPNSKILPQNAVNLAGAQIVTAPNETAANVPLGVGVRSASILEEQAGSPGWVKIGWELSAEELLRLRSVADSNSTVAAALESAEKGTQLEGWVVDKSPEVRRYASIGQSLVNSTVWIGRLFLAMIKMVVVPLVFCSLVGGVASLGDFRRLGQIGGRTIGIFMCTTVVALTIGVTLANVVRPGRFISEADKAALLSTYEGAAGAKVVDAASAPSLTDQLIGIVPTNPISSLASGDMLQIIFFALMLGIALTLLDPEKSTPVVKVLDGINEAMVMLVHIVMKLAPIGVATLLFEVVGNTGLSVLLALGVYGLVVMGGLLLHLFITYGSIVRWGAKLPFFAFLGSLKEALALAFSTSSSSATLPVTMECCESNLNISPSVTSFVLPLGATVNMDGTALYQGVAAIFIAQIYGIPLDLGDQATIVATATLASVGAAGVPGAGMVTLAMVLTAIGVPAPGLALVLGVDRLLDMFRTATNVAGDSSVTAFMARLDGDDLRILSDAEDAANPSVGFEGRLQTEEHPITPSGE
ncbi:MAG: dicarboxylate/amino acid:cation symporter [Myxococcota bacterium]|nr:dicarboxylate/amino acid:cation symporter [Myxococcota bacterium]